MTIFNFKFFKFSKKRQITFEQIETKQACSFGIDHTNAIR